MGTDESINQSINQQTNQSINAKNNIYRIKQASTLIKYD
jgi:hypothetical protein